MCDYYHAFILARYKNPNISYPQSQLKFFENLEPIDGAVEAYFKLKEQYNVILLTAPSVNNPLCYMEKRLWVEKHLGLAECDKLHICVDKTLSRGRYLIDDCVQKGLLKPEWEQIFFGSKRFPDWDSVLAYLIKP
jgi:5'(3')-deoxyribonucleotidase